MTERDDPPPMSPPGCPYCGRSFPDDDILALHLGRTHGERLSTDEQSRFEAALGAEREALRRLQLQAVAGLIVLYFGFLFAYTIVT